MANEISEQQAKGIARVIYLSISNYIASHQEEFEQYKNQTTSKQQRKENEEASQPKNVGLTRRNLKGGNQSAKNSGHHDDSPAGC